MDDIGQQSIQTVGERLRAAREAQGMSVEELASVTRIPTRHLVSLETSDWASLPAPTYSMGFAKNYATAVGLDRSEIADQLREEMGGLRPAYMQASEVFEPADPKRVMPKGLVLGALIALAIVALGLTWLSNRQLAEGDAAPVAANGIAPVTPAAPTAPTAAAPVLITANEPAWIDVRDGTTVLRQGELGAGQSFEVPATAVAPTLTTAKPEALRISVGTADAPAIGPAGKRVSNVSLKPADLMRAPVTATDAAVAPPATPAQVRREPRPAARQPAPAPISSAPVVEPAPASPPPSVATTNSTP
jgi:cytoskeletal protein RodZ